MSIEIEVPGILLRRAAWTLLILLALTVLGELGYHNTPLGQDGRPLLLTPRLAAITHFQAQAKDWLTELKGIQQGLADLLQNPSPDLLSQENQIGALSSRAALLQAEVQDSPIPATMQDLETGLQAIAEETSAAVTKTGTWIDQPTSANLAAARDSLNTASADRIRTELESWMQLP
jgi:hypothetical protein